MKSVPNRNSQRVVAGNLSESLYDQNMKMAKPSKSVSQAFSNLKSVSDINALSQQDNDLKKMMPAFLEQAHLSTYYQNNPWDILTNSTKYGLPVLGGDLSLDQAPGYKPGNVLAKKTRFQNKDKISATSSPEITTIPVTGHASGETIDFFSSTPGIILIVLLIIVVGSASAAAFARKRKIVS